MLYCNFFLLFIFVVFVESQQTYYQQQSRQYPQQRQQAYRPSPTHGNYYRIDSPPSNQFNVSASAISYSNKFQSPVPQLTTITPQPAQRHHYSNVHQNIPQRQVQTQAPSYGTCNVPSDFWCDSFELSQRCGVVEQCNRLKRQTAPITVTLMFEALCPFCQRFISNHLGNLYDQFRGKIEIELVPWGNARLLQNGQISCNHGQPECDANRMMSCVIDVVKIKLAIPFIVCFERQLTTYPQVDQAMHHCSTFIRNDYREIRQCYVSERGRQLQRQAAYRTMNIRAHPIIEVPYIVINNYSPSSEANGINISNLQLLLNKWLSSRQS
jgi:interferon gamma-inducible protein 30